MRQLNASVSQNGINFVISSFVLNMFLNTLFQTDSNSYVLNTLKNPPPWYNSKILLQLKVIKFSKTNFVFSLNFYAFLNVFQWNCYSKFIHITKRTYHKFNIYTLLEEMFPQNY